MNDLIIASILGGTYAACYTAKKNQCKKLVRKQKRHRGRLDCLMHFNLLLHENEFQSFYRMSRRSFNRLLCLVAPFLYRNKFTDLHREQICDMDYCNKFQLTIHYLDSGGACHSLRAYSGYSRSSVSRIILEVMEAILQVDELKLHFPSSNVEATSLVKGFRSLSSNGIIDGCVGIIDGLLCPIIRPRKMRLDM